MLELNKLRKGIPLKLGTVARLLAVGLNLHHSGPALNGAWLDSGMGKSRLTLYSYFKPSTETNALVNEGVPMVFILNTMREGEDLNGQF
jgi:hypothetical protein